MENTKMQMSSLYMSGLHWMLLDYLVERLGGRKSTTRSDIIRQAVEPYVTQHETWDPDTFLAFVKERV